MCALKNIMSDQQHSKLELVMAFHCVLTYFPNMMPWSIFGIILIYTLELKIYCFFTL